MVTVTRGSFPLWSIFAGMVIQALIVGLLRVVNPHFGSPDQQLFAGLFFVIMQLIAQIVFHYRLMNYLGMGFQAVLNALFSLSVGNWFLDPLPQLSMAVLFAIASIVMYAKQGNQVSFTRKNITSVIFYIIFVVAITLTSR